ncbi:Na+-transporting NADH:ubiquinone oxidoreductase subunit F [Natronincola peptidivorans]|uniref:Na+-transporting NADH:ubiquinone oxidoreductase subunit F n=1 Tax=Natronincola peptidivorans TaxID=426128 RepID=A0A1I0FV12_9FIRM|nr:2Fe-2S iron-sulfur cluster binding domain-containing protein [Natronincola peptidivorans]SET62105.1 Na+-transporting NADH:ubiquinone oxidoreductase subunit F [Natronincola peptidivorans]
MSTILITVLIITGIATLLAFLLTFADAYIADYGECKIIVNKDEELVVEGGSSLLSSLTEHDIYLPSACGGKGSCGYCKCKINEGAGPVLPTELSYLTEEDVENNIRLTCQVKVKEDMYIEIPEDLLHAKKYTAVVETAKDLTPNIRFLKLKITDGQEIEFLAGQYVQLLAPPYPGNPDEVYRAYSIASSTTETNSIDLIIGYVPDGIVTTYVHKHLSEGDEVSFNGPFGDFYLNDSDKDAVLVAVSTGMAPIRSILYEMLHKEIDRNTVFYFGARTREDLFMLDEMEMFEESLPRFKFVPVLSRATEEDQWEGEEGRVTDLIEKYLEEGENKEAYLCGGAPMIKSTIEALVEKGFKEEMIYFDEF